MNTGAVKVSGVTAVGLGGAHFVHTNPDFGAPVAASFDSNPSDVAVTSRVRFLRPSNAPERIRILRGIEHRVTISLVGSVDRDGAWDPLAFTGPALKARPVGAS
jgi:hypothetical protein